jgi:hypothetical protein
MTPLTFIHANTKREVVVTKEFVWNIMRGADGSTHLVSVYGAIIPVAESIDKARILVYGAPAPKAGDDATSLKGESRTP